MTNFKRMPFSIDCDAVTDQFDAQVLPCFQCWQTISSFLFSLCEL